ncbi:CRISPR-associated protein Csb1 [Austwickia chelonae]|uniref:Type I-U CRISPR-associated protein Cas7 n=1 Tax=Austwickia chelonae NBRC 105200 TaxID=1184607 RepID=K6VU81_9MICO|nr:type I-U CRISPR-associated RAMP protein Csb1/Cas7u [Austwickia chelonae]GAB78905.1 hypothetical protein AUCHE_17_01170 [Austwickia chelonae NBRC 105200]SEV86250.1 CRISPR-associated protein Csb1 [Austwickia chelonae]
MTTSSSRAVIEQLTAWAADPNAAGIQIRTTFNSPLPTVTPPAGTLRADRKDIAGEFPLPDGTLGVTIDSWASQASRMEAAAETLAEEIGFPLVRFVTEDGKLLTTSARLSHRHADATWRAAQAQIKAAEIPFQEIQNATVNNAGMLLRWQPLAVLFGWWHSHIAADAKSKKAAPKGAPAAGGDKEVRAALAGYARVSPDARSARVVTSEVLATGVARRLRMTARVDSLFGPLQPAGRTSKLVGEKPSTVGLGSLPPVEAGKAPVDVTFEKIEGRWWFSLAGLRRFDFGPDVDADTARALLVALALLLRDEAIAETRLRAGTELIAAPEGTTGQVLRHNAPADALPVLSRAQLIDIVRDLGAQLGWGGPVDVPILPGSVLARLLETAKTEQAEDPVEGKEG